MAPIQFDGASSFPVKNTFIHYASDAEEEDPLAPSSALNRSASGPALLQEARPPASEKVDSNEWEVSTVASSSQARTFRTHSLHPLLDGKLKAPAAVGPPGLRLQPSPRIVAEARMNDAQSRADPDDGLSACEHYGGAESAAGAGTSLVPAVGSEDPGPSTGSKFSPQAFTQRVREQWQQDALKTAMARIDEIPEQMEDVLNQTVNDLSNKVDGGIMKLQGIIRAAEPYAADWAVKRLDSLSEVVASSVEARFMHAKMSVRRKVDSAIMDLEGKEEVEGDDFEQLKSLPEEVQQIADEAVELAVQDSQVELHRIKDVLNSLAEQRLQRDKELWDAQKKITAQVPHLLQQTSEAAREVAEGKIEDAVADLTSKRVPNAVVVEALLRAKSAEGETLPQLSMKLKLQPQVKATKSAAQVVGTMRPAAQHQTVHAAAHLPPASTENPSPVTNPGSRGHPEMCSRPCLFFSAGTCQSQDGCDFCHWLHARRPTHLDKRNRERLRSLSDDEKVATFLPIIREKLQHISENPMVFELLDDLEVQVAKAGEGTASDAMSSVSTNQGFGGNRTMKNALRAIMLRSLLAMLLRMLPADHVAHGLLEEVLRNIQSH